MQDILDIGQWQGFFRYGAEYGKPIAGQEAEFRLFIEEYCDGQFSGRIIDWEGIGVNGEVSTVNGLLSGDLISFTKQYSTLFGLDNMGNSTTVEGIPGHSVVYEGRLDPNSKSFLGTWKIRLAIGPTGKKIVNHVATGTWRMAVRQEQA
ncbi:MAG: hypothetical protein EOO60_13605 [Hymenobacter sp.]|nr:MAG: hypothetical protein EOO60_13605 [Hymenobacter sp.]